MAGVTRSFREGLKRELPRWRDEGLLSPDAASALHARYALGEVESGPGLLPVYVLGALLVGAGVVSLVAWHWESMADAAKLLVLGGVLVLCHAGGAWLWMGSGRAPRLGHAITFLGTLVFGASIGLVAQIFHVSGVWWGAFGAFAAGALGAGILYGSLPHHLLAAVLALGVFGPGFARDHPANGVALAYGLAALFLGLALLARSRALAVVTGLGLGATLAFALEGANASRASVLAATCVAAAWAAAPLVARGEAAVRVAGGMRVAGRVAFALAAWGLSFEGLAYELRFRGRPDELVLAATVPVLVVAAAALVVGLRRDDVDPLARGEGLLAAATAIAFGIGLLLPSGRGAALVANLALAFLALGRIARGLTALARAPFWEGIALAGLLLVSRFLEIETALWLKGAGFIACGAAVLAGGFAFERRRIRREVANVA
jgi:hypothetical protein